MSQKTLEVFFSCGDPSGDMHAAGLARQIKKLCPGARISAMGGERIKKECDNFIFDLVGLNVHGFYEPVKNIFRLRSALKSRVMPYFKSSRPDIVIPVDYYGFNIKLAEAAKREGIPVHYFISPQIWASRAGRIEKLKRFIDHIYVIFPFEEKIYREAGIPVTFVGHPFLDTIPAASGATPGGKRTIGIFPGSRKSVINWNLPNMMKTAEIVRKSLPDVNFAIIGLESLKNSYSGAGSIDVIYEKDYQARKNFSLALCTSGTVTLENALLGLPMIVTYRLPWAMYYLIKSMILVSSVTIVNLICNEQVVPELIQGDAKPERLAEIIISWMSDKKILQEKKQKFIEMRKMLGEPGSYERTAKLILNSL